MSRFGALLQTWSDIDRREQEANEQAFDTALRDYLLRQKPYKHGGVVNALQSIAAILHEVANEGEGISREGRKDYQLAADLITACSEQVDFDYMEA